MGKHKDYGLSVLEQMFRDQNEDSYTEADCGA